MRPATCFIALICAEPPTRDTEMPTLMAGRTPELKRSVSRKIWPSVIEMTFVGMYADTYSVNSSTKRLASSTE